MIEQTYFLDMIPGESTPPVVHVSQFDVNSRTLTFNLMKGGVAYVPDAGMSVTLDGMKPDNHVFSYPMTVNGSSVSINVQTQMTVVSGHVRCEVSVSNQTGKIGSANFILAVEESAIDSGSISESDIPIFEDLKNQAQQAAADAEQSASDAESAASSVSAILPESAGTAGQVLTKTANGADWQDVDGLPAGGTTGQVLTKRSNTDGDADWETIDATDIETSSGVAIKSVNGNPVTIADALQDKALGVNTTLEPIQSGSGTPSPTNVRPITGRTSVDVTRTGKNLLKTNDDLSWIPSLTKNADGSIQVVGSRTSSGTYVIGTVDLKANTNYVLSASGNDDLYYQMLANGATAGAARLTDFTYTPTEDVTATIRIFARGNVDFNNVLYPQLELGSTSTAYEPYQEQSVTVQLGQTVYGGTLDVTTGELTVETANIASYNGESIGEPWWSSMDEYVAGTTPTTGAQVVYTLATPTTVSLTPAQIQLLTTTNIISTSADDLSVRYYATGQTGNVEGNLSFLLDKTASNETAVNTVSESIAPAETGIATQNHAVGDYILLNGQLYVVTAAVNTGETFIEGTNISAAVIGDTLTALNKGLLDIVTWRNVDLSVTIPAGGTIYDKTLAIPTIPGFKAFAIGGWRLVGGGYANTTFSRINLNEVSQVIEYAMVTKDVSQVSLSGIVKVLYMRTNWCSIF